MTAEGAENGGYLMKVPLMLISIFTGSMLLTHAVQAGTVQEQNKKAVVDFYDAVVSIDKISAVRMRIRNR